MCYDSRMVGEELGALMEPGRCSIARTLDFVGDRWSLLILREASFYGITRFEQLRTRLGISKAVLTDRLDGLVAHGILERTPYQPAGERVRHEYKLTAAGSDLFPVLVALLEWGDKHRNEGLAPITLTHTECGAAVTGGLTCAKGHQVDQTEVAPQAGPGLRRDGKRPKDRAGKRAVTAA